MNFVAAYTLNAAGLLTGREPSRPLLFSYYVTHRCALACRYCCDGQGKPFKETLVPELDTPDAKRLISFLRKSSDTLDVTGGEPLLRDDLEDILQHARQLGMRTVLNTKGLGLSERPDLMRHVDVLVLSLDAIDPAKLAFLWQCPEEAAHQALAAVDYALARARHTGTRLAVGAVATPDNLRDVEEVLQFAQQRELAFQLSPELAGTTPNDRLRRNEEYEALVSRMARHRHAGAQILGVSAYLRHLRDFRAYRCHPLLMPVIRPDGAFAYPCLERPAGYTNILEAGGYEAALKTARRAFGPELRCKESCQIFCHMGLSLLQRRPIEALREARRWSAWSPCTEKETSVD